MHHTHGQITVFLIIGILIILAVGGLMVLYSSSDTHNTESDVNAQIYPVKSYVEDCITEQLHSVVTRVSWQGGYYDGPPRSMPLHIAGIQIAIPYYLMNLTSYVPEEATLRENIEEGLRQRMERCSNVSGFSGTVEVDTNDATVDSYLSSTTVSADVHLPVTLRKADTRIQRDRFTVSVDTPLKRMVEAARRITRVQLAAPWSICFSCLSEYAAEENLSLDMRQSKGEGNHAVIYTLAGDGADDAYMFAHRLMNEEAKEPQVSIKDIGTLDARIGYEFSHHIHATGKNLTFHDESALFNISEDGRISFVPSYEEAGDHLVRVWAQDQHNNTDEELFTLSVHHFGEAPYMDYIGTLHATAGERFTHRVNVTNPSNETLTFTDDSPLFDIRPHGLINFTPNSTGTHSCNITVMDPVGKSHTQNVHIVIQ